MRRHDRFEVEGHHVGDVDEDGQLRRPRRHWLERASDRKLLLVWMAVATPLFVALCAAAVAIALVLLTRLL